LIFSLHVLCFVRLFYANDSALFLDANASKQDTERQACLKIPITQSAIKKRWWVAHAFDETIKKISITTNLGVAYGRLKAMKERRKTNIGG
jgi:hypothetical protein